MDECWLLGRDPNRLADFAMNIPATSASVATATNATVDTAMGRGFIRGLIWAIGAMFEWFFGLGALIVGLAVLATVPVAGLGSLGYFLEATGRVGRSGRLRDG